MPANIITTTNTWAKFEGAGIQQARKLLRYRKKGYVFTRAYKLGVWDGYIELMNRSGGFAAGLVPWLVEQLTKNGIAARVVDNRPPAPAKVLRLANTVNTLDKLRPHQEEATAAIIEAERGIVWQPTAAGKTEVMIELSRLIGRKALVLVHRKDLLYQTAAAFKATLGDRDIVGIIGDGQWSPNVVTIATFQSIYARLKERLPEVERWLREEIAQVHVDETHHLPAKSYERVMEELWSARWRVGYSATPYKEDNRETFLRVMSWLGPTAHRAEAKQLTEEGYLVPVDVFLIETDPPRRIYRSWEQAVDEGIIHNPSRHDMIVALAKKLSVSGPVAVLVERLAHGEALAEALQVPFIAGASATAERQRAWDTMRTAKSPILVASTIADEGIDIPPLRYLILAGGGKAPHRTIQRVGRGMRTAEGKDRLYVFDFLDQGKYLSAHAKKRKATYHTQPAYQVAEVDFERLTSTLLYR